LFDDVSMSRSANPHWKSFGIEISILGFIILAKSDLSYRTFLFT